MSSNQLGAIEVAVEAEGVEDASDDISGVGDEMEQAGRDADAGGGGGGGGGGGLMGGRMGRLLGILGGILGVLSLMPALQQGLGAIINILKAFLAPVSLMLLRLLRPVMIGLLKLLPKWMKFVENQQGLGDLLWNGLMAIVDIIRNFDLNLFNAFRNAIADALPGVSSDASEPIRPGDPPVTSPEFRNRGRGPNDRFDSRQERQTIVNIEADAGEFLKAVEVDDTLSLF